MRKIKSNADYARWFARQGGLVKSERKTRAAKLRGFKVQPISNARCPYCGARLSIYNDVGRCYRYPCRKAHKLASKGDALKAPSLEPDGRED